jgi:2-(3-amino-3-carboxypropyl)histidine synthase
MEISGYSIDLEKTVKTITDEGYKIVALQLPEGLKSYASKFVEFLENKTDVTVIIIADSCFGACDIPNYQLKNLDVDFVIQIGHTPIPDIVDIPIPNLFINAQSKTNIDKVVEKSINHLDGKKIGIVATAQHLHEIKNVCDILTNHDFEPVVSEGDGRIYANGQILGCNFSAAINILENVDSFLFLGSGNFHPVGLLICSKKPVVAADPYTNEVKKLELEELKDTILRQRYGAIANSKNSKKFGILIGIKQGQQRMDLAFKVKDLLKEFNRKSMFIALEFFSPTALQCFRDIDCFISTACPRIAIDDYLLYKKPILTPIELEIVLGKRKWDDYQFDQIINI